MIDIALGVGGEQVDQDARAILQVGSIMIEAGQGQVHIVRERHGRRADLRERCATGLDFRPYRTGIELTQVNHLHGRSQPEENPVLLAARTQPGNDMTEALTTQRQAEADDVPPGASR